MTMEARVTSSRVCLRGGVWRLSGSGTADVNTGLHLCPPALHRAADSRPSHCYAVLVLGKYLQ